MQENQHDIELLIQNIKYNYGISLSKSCTEWGWNIWIY